MNDLDHLTLWETAGQLRRGDLSPLELTRALLERIEQKDPQINSFITVTPELALQQARQAEAEISRGEWRGPLHGIPLALKDLYETAGIRTTVGTSFFAEYFPEEDAAVVQRLQQAGAVILGKTNLHEIALGITNENPHYGVCHNPWDTARITGGSSGGSAAALAAGFCLGALGTDTGGSIRIPASLCGVVGLKPTRGRVSLRGVFPLSWNLDHAGPMARCVRDVALLLQVIAGHDLLDPYSRNVPVPDYLSNLEEGMQGWRVALASGDFFDEAEAPVLEAVRKAARVFEGLGAIVEEAPVPEVRQMAQANGLMVVSDAAAVHRERLQSHPEGFGADVLERLRMGAAYSSTDYIQARRTQSLARHWFGLFFERYDLLMLPATPLPAPLIGAQDAVTRARQLTRFTAPFNLTGLPAISIPCGFVNEGGKRLPLGLQLVSRAWDEQRLLRAAFAYEGSSI